MAATSYGNHHHQRHLDEAQQYRDSLRSAQSASVYSTDSSSSYIESSPLDSIIRDYPPVPGASHNAFKYPPAVNGYPTSESPSLRSQRPQQSQQQQPRSAETPLRLREYSPADDHLTANLNAQAHDRPNSSPLLHTRFRSPTNSASPEPRDPRDQRRPSPDAGAEDNFIDLRDSGTFDPPPPNIHAPSHSAQSSYSNYSFVSHGVPPRNGHGVTPIFGFSRPTAPPQKPTQSLTSRFSPITPDVVEAPQSLPQSKPGVHEFLNAGNSGTSNARDDYFDRSSWGTQYSDPNAARQTWMTSTSGVTVGDPFAFRHYETPQTTPNYPMGNAPTVVVHEPQTPTNLNMNGYQAQGSNVVEPDEAVDIYAYTPPSPLEPPTQGRMPSKVPVVNRYNFSRPMRSEATASTASSSMGVMPERDSEYSMMSGSTELPHTIMGFPDPPIPNPSAPASFPPPSSYSQEQPLAPSLASRQDSDPPLTRRAIARMSIPKTIPNLVYTDDQITRSPNMEVLDISPANNDLRPNRGGSPGRPGTNQASTPRNLSPIPDRSPNASPVSSRHGSPRIDAPSPLPGPPRTYEVPYSYNVTITGQQYEATFNRGPSSSSHSDHSAYHSGSQHGTRYSVGGTALPPAPKEVVELPSSPPPTQPRPGTSISLYSRYSFYSVGDLPNSGETTPQGRSRHGSENDSPANRTPTPTSNNKGKGTVEGDYQGLPYLSTEESAVPPSSPTPQECLLRGISHHEANRLEESAHWFERAANEQGGCAVGMLMWGLSLRHAWGVEKDERAAFWWLRRAAECAVADMEKATDGVSKEGNNPEKERDRKAVQSELVLAVYEVGQCFFHGWGVETDKKMAVSYFQVAARLGDVDAQLELGFCYANGKGCKKDLKEAAKWYRAAAAQGASTVGLAWIYKPKYGGGGENDRDASMDKLSRPVLPSSMGSAASVKSGKSDGRRRLKKPPPRSPGARSKSPARTEFSSVIGTVDSP